MCDRVGIIVNGKLIRVTSVEELVQGEHITGGRYRYHISDSEKASQIIGGFQNASVIETDPNHLEILLEAGNEQILSEINRKLVLNGIELYTVAPIEGQKLEDAFIELTKGDGQIA